MMYGVECKTQGTDYMRRVGRSTRMSVLRKLFFFFFFQTWKQIISPMEIYIGLQQISINCLSGVPQTALCYSLQSENESEVAQSCLTLCDSVDCSLPASSFYGILQTRILEWVAISFSKGSSFLFIT